MFGLHFIKSGLIDKEHGRFYSDIFDKRQTGDYDDFIEYDEEEVVALVKPAKDFVAAIENLLNPFCNGRKHLSINPQPTIPQPG